MFGSHILIEMTKQEALRASRRNFDTVKATFQVAKTGRWKGLFSSFEFSLRKSENGFFFLIF